MAGELNQESRDLLYVGRSGQIIDKVRILLPDASVLQITNYNDLVSYLTAKRDLFELAIQVGKGRVATESAIYPSLVLAEPEFPENPDGSGEVADGLAFLDAMAKYICVSNSFLVMPDSYLARRIEILATSRDKGIRVIEESELESRLVEFVI